jgi:hypothetical protein
MIRLLTIGALSLTLSSAALAQPAPAVNDRAARVLELMEKSGMTAVIDALTQQVAGSTAQTLRNANVALKPQFIDMLQETVVGVARDNSGDLMQRLVPLYARQFSDGEIRQLTAFYDSPLGRKLVQVQPQLINEATQVGQVWGASLLPAIYVQLQVKCQFQPGVCPDLNQLLGALRP